MINDLWDLRSEMRRPGGKKVRTTVMSVNTNRTIDAASQAPQGGAWGSQREPGPDQTTSMSQWQRPLNRKSEVDALRQTKTKTNATTAGASKNKVARQRRDTRVIRRSRVDICSDRRYGEKDEMSAEATKRDTDSVVLVPNTNDAVCAPEAE